MKQYELFPEAPTKSDRKAKMPKPKGFSKTPRPRRSDRTPVDPRLHAERTDTELITLAVAGHEVAMNTLLSRHEKPLKKYLVQKFRDFELAKDVTQEALLKAAIALPSFRGDSKFLTWLTRIAINVALNYFVAMKRRPPQQDFDAADVGPHQGHSNLTNPFTPEDMLITEETADRISQAFEALPTELRQCLELRELQGLTYEQIAERSRCPIGTVRSRLFRARERLGINFPTERPLSPVR